MREEYDRATISISKRKYDDMKEEIAGLKERLDTGVNVLRSIKPENVSLLTWQDVVYFIKDHDNRKLNSERSI